MAVSARGARPWTRCVRRALRAWLRWDRHGLLAVLAGAGAHAGVLVLWGDVCKLLTLPIP